MNLILAFAFSFCFFFCSSLSIAFHTCTCCFSFFLFLFRSIVSGCKLWVGITLIRKFHWYWALVCPFSLSLFPLVVPSGRAPLMCQGTWQRQFSVYLTAFSIFNYVARERAPTTRKFLEFKFCKWSCRRWHRTASKQLRVVRHMYVYYKLGSSPNRVNQG